MKVWSVQSAIELQVNAAYLKKDICSKTIPSFSYSRLEFFSPSNLLGKGVNVFNDRQEGDDTDMEVKSKLLPSQKAKIPRGKVHIIEERCKSCGLCIDFCPRQVLRRSNRINDRGYHVVELKEDPEEGKICIACGFCQVICPEYAIWVEEEES